MLPHPAVEKWTEVERSRGAQVLEVKVGPSLIAARDEGATHAIEA